MSFLYYFILAAQCPQKLAILRLSASYFLSFLGARCYLFNHISDLRGLEWSDCMGKGGMFGSIYTSSPLPGASGNLSFGTMESGRFKNNTALEPSLQEGNL